MSEGEKKVLERKQKRSHNQSKGTWMLAQECFEPEISLIWADFLARHCMTRAIGNGTDCSQSVSFLSLRCN